VVVLLREGELLSSIAIKGFRGARFNSGAGQFLTAFFLFFFIPSFFPKIDREFHNMRCIYCGYENEEGAKDCASCQRSISTIVTGTPGSLAAILASANAQPAGNTEPEVFNFSRTSATPPPETANGFSKTAATPPPEAEIAFSKGAATPPPEAETGVNFPNWLSENPTPPPLPKLSFDLSQSSVPAKPQQGGKLDFDLEELLALSQQTQNSSGQAVQTKPPVAPPKKEAKPVPVKPLPKPPAEPKQTSLTSNEFVCPRCNKVRSNKGAIVVTDGNSSRLVCYQCAREVRDAEKSLSRATAKDWLPAFLSGLVMAGFCGAGIFGLTLFMPQLWLFSLAIVGGFVGCAVRVGASNHGGISLAIIAVVLSMVGYAACVYGNVAALYARRLIGWEEFNTYFARINLSVLEWVSAGVGLVVAIAITLDRSK
jgi:hypothetical protein